MSSTRATGGGAPALSRWYNRIYAPKHASNQKMQYPCSQQDFRGPFCFLLSTMRLNLQHCSNTPHSMDLYVLHLFFFYLIFPIYLVYLIYLMDRIHLSIGVVSGVHCTKSCVSVVPLSDLCHKVVMFARCHSLWSTRIYYCENLTKMHSTKKYWKDPKMFGPSERGTAGNGELKCFQTHALQPEPRAVACALAVKDDVSAKARRLGRGHWMVIIKSWFWFWFVIMTNLQSTWKMIILRQSSNKPPFTFAPA